MTKKKNNETSQKPFSILHHLNIINFMAFIVPVLTSVIVFVVYCTYTKQNRLNYLPYISDFTYFNLEGRIMTAGMSATTFIIMFVIYIRSKIIIILKRKVNKLPERRYKITVTIMTISSYISIICHLLITLFTLADFEIVHTLFLNLMYYSFIAYFFTGDMVFKLVGYPTIKLSRTMTMVCFTFALTFMALRFYIPNDPDDFLRLDVSNVFGLLAYVTLYFKIFVTKYDLPECGIRLSRRISI